MATIVYCSVILGLALLALNSLKFDVFVGLTKMFDDAVSRNSLVKLLVQSYWIVVFTNALRFATVVLALPAGHVACIGANVET